MSDSSGGGAFFTGFIVGGLVGAAAALLWTPQSGETTRVQLRERGIELKTQLGDKTVEVRGQAGKFAADLQERGKGTQAPQENAETPSEEELAADEEPSTDNSLSA
jgi:gas vesicle protein